MAKIINDSNVTAEILADQIVEALHNKPERAVLAPKIQERCFPDAAARLAQEALHLVK